LEGDLAESGQLDYPIPPAAAGSKYSRRRLYLDDILANENGTLEFSSKGKFSSTVIPDTNVEIDFSNGQLTAHLKTTSQDVGGKIAQIVLPERLINHHGRFNLKEGH